MEPFDILPMETSLHIFSLLPIESASDCALVSKSWKNFIHSPSFYGMHSARLLELVEVATAECDQRCKEYLEYFGSTAQLVQNSQSREQLKQTHEEKINSMRLADEKLINSVRLAMKCATKCLEYTVPGEYLLKAGGRNQSIAKELDSKGTKSKQVLTSSDNDADEVVAAKDQKSRKRKVSKTFEDSLPSRVAVAPLKLPKS